MAQLQLQPPAQFDFKNPDDWCCWKQHFEQFQVASGLTGNTHPKQVSTLPYCLGEEAEATPTSTEATDNDHKDYSKVIEKFDAFLNVRKNVIIRQARFNDQCQQDGESDAPRRDDLWPSGSGDSGLLPLQTFATQQLTLDKAIKYIHRSKTIHEQAAW